MSDKKIAAAINQQHIKTIASTIEPPRLVGAGDGTRTRNLLITNQGLCQLSYSGFIFVIYPTLPEQVHEEHHERISVRDCFGELPKYWYVKIL